MTLQEFSDQFDVLYNNITSNQAPGLDEYEKSVFLTKAQNEVLKAYFDPLLNKTQEGFDSSPRRMIDFSMVTKVQELKVPEGLTSPDKPNPEPNPFMAAKYDPRPNSVSVTIPTDILAIINERVVVTRAIGKPVKTEYLTVVPIHYTEYDRLMSKPHMRPLKRQAWRVFTGDGSNAYSDIVVGPNDLIRSYTLRYIMRPTPIILENVEAGLTIDGEEGPKVCVLDPALHPVILQRGVELASAVYKGDLTTQIALGQSSQTEMGIVQSSK